MIRKILSPFVSSLVVLFIFLLDRGTKFLIQKNLAYGDAREILPFFHLTHVENTGAAFSLGQNRNFFFIIASIVILIVLFFLKKQMEKSDPDNRKTKIALSLVIGGALGNLYDRIVYGAVIDFLDFFVGTHHWPAFNVADSAISVGVFLLILSQWKTTKSPSTGQTQQ